MFACCIIGLVSGITNISINIGIIFGGGNVQSLSIAALPFWFIMIQSATWAYCTRIKAIGGYLNKQERIVRYVPWLVFVFQVVLSVYFITATFTGVSIQAYLIIRILFSILIAIIELSLYYLLIRKVMDLLEYRMRIKKLLAYELTGSLVLLMILDLLLIVSFTTRTKLDYILRPFTYLLRIVVLIRFFGDLLEELAFNTMSRISDLPDSLMPNCDGKSIEQTEVNNYAIK